MEQRTTDILVAGSGIAGLGAAISAAEQGAKVTVLEKRDMVGGISVTGMGIFAVESRLQKLKNHRLAGGHGGNLFPDRHQLGTACLQPDRTPGQHAPRAPIPGRSYQLFDPGYGQPRQRAWRNNSHKCGASGSCTEGKPHQQCYLSLWTARALSWPGKWAPAATVCACSRAALSPASTAMPIPSFRPSPTATGSPAQRNARCCMSIKTGNVHSFRFHGCYRRGLQCCLRPGLG